MIRTTLRARRDEAGNPINHTTPTTETGYEPGPRYRTMPDGSKREIVRITLRARPTGSAVTQPTEVFPPKSENPVTPPVPRTESPQTTTPS